MNFRGSNSAEGGTYQLADMYRRGPNPLADMDRGVHIRAESKSAVTPAKRVDSASYSRGPGKAGQLALHR